MQTVLRDLFEQGHVARQAGARSDRERLENSVR